MAVLENATIANTTANAFCVNALFRIVTKEHGEEKRAFDIWIPSRFFRKDRDGTIHVADWLLQKKEEDIDAKLRELGLTPKEVELLVVSNAAD